jgi:peptide methionine sulfoxide reductase msrA/msrB
MAFHPADDVHQDYHKKQPLRYQGYKEASGRAGHLRRMWEGNRSGPTVKPSHGPNEGKE